ncbi:MAG: hypothetical protein ABI668_08415, partial [Sphingorhabdus sp.]
MAYAPPPQDLNSPQVARSLVDERSLRSTHRMRSVLAHVETFEQAVPDQWETVAVEQPYLKATAIKDRNSSTKRG